MDTYIYTYILIYQYLSMGDVTASLDCQTWMELRLQILRLGLKVGPDALQPNVAESLHNKA